VTGASLGRLIGGALAMPTIARVMGAMLLRLSHVVPLVRAIIAAPRLPPPLPPVPVFSLGAAINGLVGIWGGGGAGAVARPAAVPIFGAGLGAKVLSGFFLTSHEWAASDPVWYDDPFFPLDHIPLTDQPLPHSASIGGEMLSDLAYSLW
jgi:hypothetical protein